MGLDQPIYKADQSVNQVWALSFSLSWWYTESPYGYRCELGEGHWDTHHGWYGWATCSCSLTVFSFLLGLNPKCIMSFSWRTTAGSIWLYALVELTESLRGSSPRYSHLVHQQHTKSCFQKVSNSLLQRTDHAPDTELASNCVTAINSVPPPTLPAPWALLDLLGPVARLGAPPSKLKTFFLCSLTQRSIPSAECVASRSQRNLPGAVLLSWDGGCKSKNSSFNLEEVSQHTSDHWTPKSFPEVSDPWISTILPSSPSCCPAQSAWCYQCTGPLWHYTGCLDNPDFFILYYNRGWKSSQCPGAEQ